MPQLLFDSNISFRIKKLLQKQFPSFHISDLVAKTVSDIQLWKLAKEKKLIIVTYDEDFNDIQTLKGFPPKIIWLRFGNQTTIYIANKILLYQEEIRQLDASDDLGILEIY
jgi:predicted nuclease of predicted toxin-antitoxin system